MGLSVLALMNRELFIKLQYNPYLAHHNKQWYRFLTHALIHAGWIHLGVNMYVLYLFGNLTETFYDIHFGGKGMLFYLLLYVGGTLFSSLPALKKNKDNYSYNAVGASGAVSAVLFASILFIPMQPIRFFFIPIEMPAFVFGFLYLVFEIYQSKKAMDNIAHDAHYWGAIFGVLYTILIKPSIIAEFLWKIFG